MVWLLFLLFFFLNVIDFYLTTQILRSGGNESNPIIHTLYRYTGLYGALFFKLIFTLLIGVLVFFKYFLELEMIAANVLYAIALYVMFHDYRLTRSQ